MPHLGTDAWGSYDEHGNVAGEQTAETHAEPQRVTFKATGNAGTVVSSAQRTGLGDLDGLWHHVRFDDGETIWVHSSSVAKVLTEDEQRAANERAQIAEVFGVTGGELMGVPWMSTVTHEQFPYWYEGVPDFDDREFDVMLTYRTVCNQELYGMAPEQIMDDEGTWKVVARYSNSGEIECPYRNDDNPPVPTKENPCPLCDADGVTEVWEGNSSGYPIQYHGYIYIGDGWAEIVYRLQEPPEVHGELAVQEHVSERGQSYVDTGIPETTFTIEADDTERARCLRMSCDAGPLAITLLAPRVGDEIARFYLRVWDLLYTADTGKPALF